jgi:MFS family permease
VATVFVVSGLAEVAVNPVIGRVSDRHGRFVPIRWALGAWILVAVGFAFADAPLLIAGLVVAASIAAGGFYTPGMALVSDRAELAGLSRGLAFGILNTAWAIGAMAGPSLGGALADALGDATPYLLGACVCAVTLVVVSNGTIRRTETA